MPEYFALNRLRTLNLNEKRRLKLEKKVAVGLVQLYPRGARPTFENCKSFFDKAYYDLLDADREQQLVASDAIGAWVVWEILRHPAETEHEFKLVRWVGAMIVQSFFEWWEKDNDLKTVAISAVNEALDDVCFVPIADIDLARSPGDNPGFER